MNRARDLYFQLRDGMSILMGRDYFHRPQPLGRFQTNPACYYNDLRAKAEWPGPRRDGIPLLAVPSLGERIIFPIMALQYGLGSLDRYFADGHGPALPQIQAVRSWLFRELEFRDSFDNWFPIFHPHKEFWSANSAMAQGQALSFLARLVSIPGTSRPYVIELMKRVQANMLQPVEYGGASIYDGSDPLLCETCTRDGNVVLNGWVFALFGIYDFAQVHDTPESHATWLLCESSLRRRLLDYIRSDGWSDYDSTGTPASPFYQELHIALLDALHILTGHTIYGDLTNRLRTGSHARNRFRYTIRKVQQRLASRRIYSREE